MSTKQISFINFNQNLIEIKTFILLIKKLIY